MLRSASTPRQCHGLREGSYGVTCSALRRPTLGSGCVKLPAIEPGRSTPTADLRPPRGGLLVAPGPHQVRGSSRSGSRCGSRGGATGGLEAPLCGSLRAPGRNKTWAAAPQVEGSSPSTPTDIPSRSAVAAGPQPAVLSSGRLQRNRTWAPPPLMVDECCDAGGAACGCDPPTPSEAPLTCSTATSTPGASTAAAQLLALGAGGQECARPSSVIRGFNSWRSGKNVGSGSYGVVYRALHQSGTIFAVKESVMQDGGAEDRKFRQKLEDELNICKHLRHPNIVHCLGHDYQDGRLYIYLEYVPGGSMAGVLSEFGPLTGQLMHKATLGLLEGLNYLHTCEPPVVHRDIKGANVLVDLDFSVKLADFGCSKRDDVTRSFTAAGSVLWMAPEVIQQDSGHGRKADLWSLGCTLLEMATAEKPWGDGAFDNLMAAVRQIGMSDRIPPIPETLPERVRDLIQVCVQRNPEDRPWAGELLSHDFVRFGGSVTWA
mmetsp:Transcript_72428/g.207779  ORF Transcript_72428/g.207779 Transcript_72428/m.207779 type:complete len:488 (-) Transcript_72428:52-1515(-)